MIQSLGSPMRFTCRECNSEFLDVDRSDDSVLAEEDTCNRHSCKTIKFGDCYAGWYKFFPDGGLYSISYLCRYCETEIVLNSFRVSLPLEKSGCSRHIRKIGESFLSEFSKKERAQREVSASSLVIDDYMVHLESEIEKISVLMKLDEDALAEDYLGQDFISQLRYRLYRQPLRGLLSKNDAEEFRKEGEALMDWKRDKRTGRMVKGGHSADEAWEICTQNIVARRQRDNEIVRGCAERVDSPLYCLSANKEKQQSWLSSDNFGMFTGRGPACIDCVNTGGSGAPPLQSPRYDEEDDYGSPEQSGSDRKRYGGNS